MLAMLVSRLWQLSEAGDPVVLLGRLTETADARLFDRLLECGVLRHAGQVTVWDVCDGCDCGAEQRVIRRFDNTPTAICVADRHRDLVLSPDDLASFEVSIPDLVAMSARASGLSGRPEEVVAGVWRLGAGPGGAAVFSVPTRQAMFRSGLLASLRHVEPDGRVLLLGPELPVSQRVAFAQASVQHAVLHQRAAKAGVSNPLALDLAWPAEAGARKARLVLYVAQKRIVFDGREASLQPRRFQLLHLLARRLRDDQPLVPAAEILTEMFGNTTEDSRARKLMGELRSDLRTQLKADDLIETRSGVGYCIALSAGEVSIRE